MLNKLVANWGVNQKAIDKSELKLISGFGRQLFDLVNSNSTNRTRSLDLKSGDRVLLVGDIKLNKTKLKKYLANKFNDVHLVDDITKANKVVFGIYQSSLVYEWYAVRYLQSGIEQDQDSLFKQYLVTNCSKEQDALDESTVESLIIKFYRTHVSYSTGEYYKHLPDFKLLLQHIHPDNVYCEFQLGVDLWNWELDNREYKMDEDLYSYNLPLLDNPANIKMALLAFNSMDYRAYMLDITKAILQQRYNSQTSNTDYNRIAPYLSYFDVSCHRNIENRSMSELITTMTNIVKYLKAINISEEYIKENIERYITYNQQLALKDNKAYTTKDIDKVDSNRQLTRIISTNHTWPSLIHYINMNNLDLDNEKHFIQVSDYLFSKLKLDMRPHFPQDTSAKDTTGKQSDVSPKKASMLFSSRPNTANYQVDTKESVEDVFNSIINKIQNASFDEIDSACFDSDSLADTSTRLFDIRSRLDSIVRLNWGSGNISDRKLLVAGLHDYSESLHILWLYMYACTYCAKHNNYDTWVSSIFNTGDVNVTRIALKQALLSSASVTRIETIISKLENTVRCMYTYTQNSYDVLHYIYRCLLHKFMMCNIKTFVELIKTNKHFADKYREMVMSCIETNAYLSDDVIANLREDSLRKSLTAILDILN